MKHFLLTSLFLTLAGALSAADRAEFRLFDFGMKNSPVWPGFVQVTEKTLYTPAQGFGWKAGKGLLGRSSGQQGRSGAPDALMGDCLWTFYSNDFLVDTGTVDEPVRVVAYVDGRQINGRIRLYGYRLKANGQEVARFDWNIENAMSENYFFKGWDTDFDPDEPIWERWAEPLHRTEIFDVTPDEGQVRLTFSGNSQVNGLVIYPVSREEQAGAFLAELHEQRKQEFYQHYFIREIPEPEPLPALSAVEQERGYIVFSRNVSEEVGFHDAPTRQEMDRPLRMFAALDEDETVAFTVLPLVDIPTVDAEVSALSCGEAEMPRSAVRLESARYRWEFIGGMTVRPKPMMLTPWTELAAPARYNRRYFLTVHVPADATPGVYRGTVRLTAAARPDTLLPLELRVLPFRLPTTTEAGLSAGYYYYAPRYMLLYGRMGQPKHPDAAQWLERDLRLMKRFNLNGFQADSSHYGWPTPDYDMIAEGNPAGFDFSSLDQDLAACRRAGIDGPGQFFSQRIHNDLIKKGLVMGSDEYRVRINNFFRLLGRHVRDQGGPELVAWLSDEVHENPSRSWNLDHDDALRYCQLVREGAEASIRTTLTLMSDTNRGKDYTDLVPACDVTQTHFWEGSQRLIATAREGGHELWGYNCGNSRYSWGFQVFRLHARGRWQWNWYTRSDLPYNPMARAGYYVVMYTPDGHFPSPWLVQAREGVDDYRYLKLLETTLAGGGTADAKHVAEAAIDDARSLPPFAIKMADGAAAGGDAAEIFPSADDFDRLRWRVAAAILALRGD